MVQIRGVRGGGGGPPRGGGTGWWVYVVPRLLFPTVLSHCGHWQQLCWNNNYFILAATVTSQMLLPSATTNYGYAYPL